MDNDEVRVNCGQCNMEFTEGDSKDPKSSSAGRSIATTGGENTEKNGGNDRKEPGNPEGDVSYIIVTVMLTIAVCFLALVAYAVYKLLPLPSDISGGIATIVVLVLVIVIYWLRRHVFRFIKWLNYKLISNRTVHHK